MVNDTIRVSNNMRKLIFDIKMSYMKKGKTPPSCRKITEMIVNKIKSEDLLYNEFIKF